MPNASADPAKPNWRNGYADHFEAAKQQWAKERDAGSSARVEVPGKRSARYVYELKDDQIRDLARREAQRDMERAINEWNCEEAESRRKFRSGQAI